MRRFSRCLFLTLWWLQVSDAAFYRWFCVNDRTIEELARNTETGELVKVTSVGGNNNSTRKLRAETTNQKEKQEMMMMNTLDNVDMLEEDYQPSVTVKRQTRRQLQRTGIQNTTVWERVEVRLCSCADPSLGDVYCPAQYHHCAIPHRKYCGCESLVSSC